MGTKIDELVRYYRKITELTVFNGLYKKETGPNAKFVPSEFIDIYYHCCPVNFFEKQVNYMNLN